MMKKTITAVTIATMAFAMTGCADISVEEEKQPEGKMVNITTFLTDEHEETKGFVLDELTSYSCLAVMKEDTIYTPITAREVDGMVTVTVEMPEGMNLMVVEPKCTTVPVTYVSEGKNGKWTAEFQMETSTKVSLWCYKPPGTEKLSAERKKGEYIEIQVYSLKNT